MIQRILTATNTISVKTGSKPNITGPLRTVGRYKYLILILISLIAAYYAAADLTGVLDKGLFPGLRQIGNAAWETRSEIITGLGSSALLLFPSYFLALLCGIVLGLPIGWYATARRNLLPLLRGASAVPPPLLIPYAIAILPTFWLASSTIIFIGCFFPVCLGTIHGVVLIEERYLDNARTLHLTGLRLLWKVILPASLPSIFSGASVALIFSFVLLTISEMFGVRSGIGFYVQYYAEFFDYDRVLAGLLVISFCVIGLMVLFDQIQKHMLAWTTTR